MDNVKPWQIILIIVALAALGFSIWKYGFSTSLESQLTNKLMLVDAETGQLYIADIGGRNGIIIPARNPDSGEISLMPVYKSDAQWFLSEQFRDSMSELTVPADAVPDITGPVSVANNAPLPFRR